MYYEFNFTSNFTQNILLPISLQKELMSSSYSVVPVAFSFLITSVIVYKTDNITLRSCESAKDIAIFLIATCAAVLFLKRTKS